MLPTIVVLAGGTSSEREVSLASGKACALALARHHPTRLQVVDRDELPAGLDRRRDVVFMTFHGGFGEGGGMQRLLEQAEIAYAGCDAAASELCLDKERTKRAAAARGVPVAPGVRFLAEEKPTAEALIARLGREIVFKPNADGSSFGLAICEQPREVAEKLASITQGCWLAEQRIRGRELTVGLLHGRAMGVVEIVPKSGVFDYTSKYTKGLTTYLAPAPVAPEVDTAVRQWAETAYAACGCRDYARIDFMMTAQNQLFLLEINTLPGMKETSLLPMSARCAGLDFTALVKELVEPALERFASVQTSTPVA
jgi:D-alanine-D-alanine ligase